MSELERLSKELMNMKRSELLYLFSLASEEIKKLQAENDKLQVEIEEKKEQVAIMRNDLKKAEKLHKEVFCKLKAENEKLKRFLDEAKTMIEGRSCLSESIIYSLFERWEA